MAKRWDTANATKLLRRVYEQILGRAPDNNELREGIAALSRGEQTVRGLVRELGRSGACFDRWVRARPVEESARELYRRFLGREPEGEHALKSCAAAIREDWRRAVDALVDSPEYLWRFGDDEAPH